MYLKTYNIINADTKEIEVCAGSNRAKAKRELEQIKKEQPNKKFKIVPHEMYIY